MEKTIKDALLFEKTKNGLTQQMMIQILFFICVPVFSALVLLLFSATYFAANDPHHSVEVYGAFAVIMLLIIALSARMNYHFYNITRNKMLIPLQQLSMAARAIQHGNFNVIVDHYSDDELGQMCDTFRTMQTNLKSSIAERAHANTSRKILFSGIAHDLRTPLTAIMGYTEALQLGLGRTKEKQMQYLNSIASCADDLSRLIEELSLYNKLSTSRIICHPQPLPFSKVIRSFIAEDQDYLDSRKVHVTYDMDDSLIAMVDEKEFQRIIFNLLTNTIKYRDKDISEVRISLHAKGKYAEFMYTDDGPGVPKEKLPHIFEAFYRTDEARSKTSNGSGLGLAIVAEIITAHKGRYSAVNNNGLQLIFEIPLAERGNTQ